MWGRVWLIGGLSGPAAVVRSCQLVRAKGGGSWQAASMSGGASTPGGPVSPDGRHQWDGVEWVPIPAPPVKRMELHDYFQVFCIVLLVVIVFGVLFAVFG